MQHSILGELLDSSKWITCAVSMVLIVYGSYRSIKLDSEPDGSTVAGHQRSKTRKVRTIKNGLKSSVDVTPFGSRHEATAKDISTLKQKNQLLKGPTSPACQCNTPVCNRVVVLQGSSKSKEDASSQKHLHNNFANVEGIFQSKQHKKHTSDTPERLATQYPNHIPAHVHHESASRSSSCDLSLSPGYMGGGAAGGGGGGGAIQVIDSHQALLLPLGASLSLLFMFYFFDSFQIFFAVAIASVATVAFAFLVHPFCHFVLKPFISLNKVSFGVMGRHLPSEVLSFLLSLSLVLSWLVTGHWLLMDLLSMGLSVSLIAHIRLPSLKVSIILLVSLLFYDVFWVFFSSYLFSSNVMVQVATQPADNPVSFLAKKFNVQDMIPQAPKLSLPGKLIFPSHMAWEESDFSHNKGEELSRQSPETAIINKEMTRPDHLHHYHHNIDTIADHRNRLWARRKVKSDFEGSAEDENLQILVAEKFLRELRRTASSSPGKKKTLWEPLEDVQVVESHMHYSMLGLGDIVMPGLLLCFVLRFDSLRGRSQNLFKATSQQESSGGAIKRRFGGNLCVRFTTFHAALLGYTFGLICATLTSEIFQAAQPALLYIVPATLLPLVIAAYFKDDLQDMWNDPFNDGLEVTPGHSRNSSLDYLGRLTTLKENNLATPLESVEVEFIDQSSRLSDMCKDDCNLDSHYNQNSDSEFENFTNVANSSYCNILSSAPLRIEIVN